MNLIFFNFLAISSFIFQGAFNRLPKVPSLVNVIVAVELSKDQETVPQDPICSADGTEEFDRVVFGSSLAVSLFELSLLAILV